MADTKISDLAAVVTLGLTDTIPVVQSGTTKKAVVSDIMDPTYSSNLKFANGFGIDFSASEGGGASSSVLDDYEEGTWTPVIADAATAGNTGTLTSSSVAYTKIGREVHLTAALTLINTSGMTSGNRAYIRGLPYTSATDLAAYGTVGLENVTFSGSYVVSVVYSFQTAVQLSTFTSGGADAGLTVGNITSGTGQIFLDVTYYAA